ncbi:MAG: tetratricopeptide repeat protein [Rikenellaceae bacterium]|nr:tetratricopeptide repeat protein [Rikenellaceae bacterium]
MDLRMIVARVLVMVSIIGTTPSLFSQQGVSDRNINTLRINKPDTSVMSVLPHKLQPAGSHTPVDKKDSLTKAQNSISKAIVSLNEGNTAMALFFIYEALNFTPEDAVKTKAIATSYYGVIQVRLGNHTKAVNAMNASDSMFTSLGDEGLLAFHYNNLGLFHQKFGNDQAAEQHFIKSLEISRNLKDYPNIAITLNQLSKGEGSLMLRKAYLMEAIGINKMLGDSLSLAENFNNLANIYLQDGLYDSSKVYLLQSRTIAEKKRASGILADNFEIFSRFYARSGNFKEAYESFKTSVIIKEGPKGLYNAGDIEQMIESRILTKKNFELQIKDNDLRIKHLTLTLTLLFSVLVIVVLLSLYIYFYINSKRRLQCLEDRQRLSEKEKEMVENELINIATYLNSRNEILSNIQSGLSKAYRLPENEIAHEVRKINMYVKNLLTKNDEVEGIIQKTEKINQDFLNKLSFLHPDITKNEKNIALMLRAGLSTKQIATLLDCNPKSVNMARYRMRTHMGMESDKNLADYLKSL